VSVDSFESSKKGCLTRLKEISQARYTAATIYVDHFSELCFVYMKRSTSVELLRSKKEFDSFARSHSISVQSYHADNGRFAGNVFIVDSKNQQQSLSYCGVPHTTKNDKAENSISVLQDHARVLVMQAKHKLPEAEQPNATDSADVIQAAMRRKCMHILSFNLMNSFSVLANLLSDPWWKLLSEF